MKMADSIVVCNEVHRFFIAQQLQSISVKNPRILLEPKGHNTVLAIVLAEFEALRYVSDDALMLVLPADHVIRDSATFETTIQQAVELAKCDILVTFGVQPTRPETGYGYIRSTENLAVAEFVEKHNLEKAQAYLDSGDCLWSSGMLCTTTGIKVQTECLA